VAAGCGCKWGRQGVARGITLAIIDDVRSIIAKSLNIPVDQLTPDKRLDELGAESLDVIEIVFALEEKYDIAIPLQGSDATRVSASGKGDGKSDAKSEGPDKPESPDKGANELPFTTVGDVAEMVEKLVAAKASK
jgi:acyl carrier protein